MESWNALMGGVIVIRPRFDKDDSCSNMEDWSERGQMINVVKQ